MTVLLLEHPPSGGSRTARRAEVAGARDSTSPTRGGLTLDALITGVWEDLSACLTVRCPACGGTMSPVVELGPRRFAAACDGCGSSLS